MNIIFTKDLDDFEWPVPEGESGIGQPPDALVRAMALARGQATDSEDDAEELQRDSDGELIIADDAEADAEQVIYHF
jgi:hypothetical protein|tara:strand:- start:637 stop:867 length:231 start_codon:yes stop_codon:yes gene_type:complete